MSSGLSQPMNLLGFTLPLGSWAQLIDRPMKDTDKSQIVSAVDALKAASDARRDAITTMIEKIAERSTTRRDGLSRPSPRLNTRCPTR
ncbi:hypothetical protein ACWFPY_01665 [Nocardia fluminea]